MAQIADDLAISRRTVELHFYRARRKLGIKPRRGEPKKATYVIKASNGMLKIGSATRVYERLRSLQNASPARLEIIGVFGKDIENKLHKLCAKHRSHGEWFEDCKPVRDAIGKFIKLAY